MQSEMQDRATRRIIQSGDWLTAQKIADIADVNISNLSVCISEWQQQGRIFSIKFQDQDYYPSYVLDPKYEFLPRPEVSAILTLLADRSGWELAFWFDSPNSYLGGRRPKEVLASEPENLLLAARMEAQGIGHG